MINKNIAKQILKQVHEEFFSERTYIAMEMYFKRLDLNGYADLFHEYAHHPLKLYLQLNFQLQGFGLLYLLHFLNLFH